MWQKEIANKRIGLVGSSIKNAQIYKNFCCKHINARSIYKTLGVDGNNNQPKYFVTLHKSQANTRPLWLLQYLYNNFLEYTSLDYREHKAHSCHHISADYHAFLLSFTFSLDRKQSLLLTEALYPECFIWPYKMFCMLPSHLDRLCTRNSWHDGRLVFHYFCSKH